MNKFASTSGRSAAGVIVSFLLMVALVGGGFFAWTYYQGRETPKETAEKILDAALAGDMDTIKSRITDASYKEALREYGTEDAFITAVKQLYSQQGGGLSCVGEGTPEGTDASLVVVAAKDSRPIFPGVPNASFGVVMVRENWRWKLDTQRTEARNVAAVDTCLKNSGKALGWKSSYERSKAAHGGSGLITLFPFPTR